MTRILDPLGLPFQDKMARIFGAPWPPEVRKCCCITGTECASCCPGVGYPDQLHMAFSSDCTLLNALPTNTLTFAGSCIWNGTDINTPCPHPGDPSWCRILRPTAFCGNGAETPPCKKWWIGLAAVGTGGCSGSAWGFDCASTNTGSAAASCQCSPLILVRTVTVTIIGSGQRCLDCGCPNDGSSHTLTMTVTE